MRFAVHGMPPSVSARVRVQRRVDMPGQAPSAQPGTFHATAVHPVSAHSQTCCSVPPCASIQWVSGVGIAPTMSGSLNIGGIGASQLRECMQQCDRNSCGIVFQMCLAPTVCGMQQPGFGAASARFAAVACDPTQWTVLDKAAVYWQ